MSLQVWLPMTKDLRQQGLSDVTVVNNGATFNSSGKLGGCYYFDRSVPNYLKINNPLTSATNGVSISFWVKLPSKGSVNDQLVHIGNGSGWANNRFTCFVRGNNSTLIFCCSDGAGTSTSTQYNCVSSALVLNQWTHVVCTYNSGKMKIYLDGVLDKEYITTIIPSFANVSYIGVGAGPNTTEPATAYLNDVRIYDHCLSQMEVKRISQGLILHYPLNNMGFGQENLAKNSNLGWNSTAYNVIQGEMYEDWVVGDTYTITIKGTPSSGCKFGLWSDAGNSHMCFFYNKIKDNIWIATATCSASQNTTKFSVWDSPSDNPTHNAHIEWIKIEKGSIATPWSPAPSDTLADMMGLNSNIEYDSSGYCHNANRASGHDNLLLSDPKGYASSAYNAYSIWMSENLKANQTYTIQFWDVNVSHSAKSAADLGIDVYWGGGNIRLKYWHGTSYFTNGHADHLVGTFTVTDAQASGSGSANSWLNLYNSVYNADGTRSMSIGKWKLEKGSVATSWTPGSYKVYTTDSPKYTVSAEFDGVDSATVPSIFDSTTRHSELTTAAWVKRTSDDANYHYYWHSSGISLCIRPYNSVNNYYNVQWTHATDSSSSANGWVNNVMPLNTWIHDVWVFDHGVMKHYVNGELVGTSDRSSTGTYILGDVTDLMGGQTSTSNMWQGGLSDFRIYATALSADDVKSLYQNSATIDADGTIHGAIR